MIHKYVMQDYPEGHEEKWGNSNKVPPGWKEITEEEFVKGKFFIYTPAYREYRQLHPKQKAGVKSEETGDCLFEAWLYFYRDGQGIAMMPDIDAGKVRYFKFGCDHSMEEIESDSRRHLHTYKCRKCGYEVTYDSSD